MINFIKLKKPYIIAEIGSNCEGSVEAAKVLIKLAAEVPVDGVKFQTYRADKLVSKLVDIEQYQHFLRMELSLDDFVILHDYALSLGIQFLSTPFDLEVIDFLDPLVPMFKVASGDLSNYPMLEKIAEKNKPILLSTGMAKIEEIKMAINFVNSVNPKLKQNGQLVLLHCVSAYPTPYEQANLLALDILKKETGLPVGYSDHTIGIEACLVAAAKGVCIIEKHFTDKKEGRSFRDHQISADYNDMKILVEKISLIEKLMGEPIKEPMLQELENRGKMRRGLYAVKFLKKGTILKKSDIIPLRPLSSLPAEEFKEVIGKRLLRDIQEYEPLNKSDLA